MQPQKRSANPLLAFLKSIRSIPGSNEEILYGAFSRLIARSPKFSTPDSFNSLSLLKQSLREGFASERPPEPIRWLTRTLCSLQREVSPTKKVHIKSHISSRPFQKKETLAILMSVETELFSQSLFDSCVQNKLWPFFVVPSSSFLAGTWETKNLLLYFEVQKEKHPFDKEDLQFIRKKLPKFLIGEIEYRSKVQFCPPNREAAIKMLVQTFQTIAKGDPIHVSIDFNGQGFQNFHFTATLCAVIPNGEKSLTDILIEANLPIGKTNSMQGKDGIREAVSVAIDIPLGNHFSSIEARKEASDALEEYIGPFRDVNGGLLEKIEENFRQFAALCDEPHYLTRTFLATIFPEELPSALTPELLLHPYRSLRKTEDHPDPDPLHFYQDGEMFSICITIPNSAFRIGLGNIIKKQYPDAFSSRLTLKDDDLICYTIQLPPSEAEELKIVALSHLNSWLEQKEQKQVLRIPSNVRFTSFDPRIGTEEETSFLHRLLFTGLTRINSKGEVENALAKEIQISDDRKHYRFHLRESYWSDGSLVTADDFIHSWETSLTPSFFSPVAQFFYPIKNGKKIKEGLFPTNCLGVRALNPLTIEIFLEYSCPYFLELCAHPAFSPIPMKLEQRDPNWTSYQGSRYVCNGSFLLHSVSNNKILLVKNPHYWDCRQQFLEKIEIEHTEREAAIELFKKQKCDALLPPILRCDASAIIDKSDNKQWKNTIETKYLFFNCRRPFFASSKIRQAISKAIDRKLFAQFESLRSIPHYTPYASHFTQLPDADPFNIAEAKALLEEGLSEAGLSLQSIKCAQIVTALNNGTGVEALVKQINQSLGLDWRVSAVPPAELFKVVAKGDADMSLYHWIDTIHNPSYFLELFSSATNPLNGSFWSSTEIKEVIQEVRIEREDKELEKLHKRAEEMLYKCAPFIPISHVELDSVTRRCLAGPGFQKDKKFIILLAYKK